MALPNFKDSFLNVAPAMRAAAIAVPMALTMGFGNVANANDGANPAPVQTVSANTTQPVSLTVTDGRILPDAHRLADAWAVQNPNGVAVSLRLGTETIPMDTIESVLRADFARAGISEVAFFFEQGKSAGTGVAFHTDEYVYGPYTLVEARKAIPTDVSQIKFNASYQPER